MNKLNEEGNKNDNNIKNNNYGISNSNSNRNNRNSSLKPNFFIQENLCEDQNENPKENQKDFNYDNNITKNLNNHNNNSPNNKNKPNNNYTDNTINTLNLNNNQQNYSQRKSLPDYLKEYTNNKNKNSNTNKNKNINLINILNYYNNIDLIIENENDINIDEDFFDGEKIFKILKKIFMTYAKYIEIKMDYYLNIQQVKFIFETLNIINDKIIPLANFIILLKRLIDNQKKISFENFTDLIAKICFKLFSFYLNNPEKCVAFFVKYHMEVIFVNHKNDIFKNNIKKKSIFLNKDTKDKDWENTYINNNIIFNNDLSRNNEFNNSININFNFNNANENNRNNLSRSMPKSLNNYDNYNNRKFSINSPIPISPHGETLNYNNQTDEILHENKENKMNKKFEDLHNNIGNINTNNNNFTELNKTLNANNNKNNNFSYNEIENYIKEINMNFVTKLIINSISPTLFIIYKHYFPHEIKRSYVKINFFKMSYDSLFRFSKDFQFVPNLISFNFLQSYYSIINSEPCPLEEFISDTEFSKKEFFRVKDFENSKEFQKGILFSFYKFCIFFIHLSYLAYPRIIKQSFSIKNFKEKILDNNIDNNFNSFNNSKNKNDLSNPGKFIANENPNINANSNLTFDEKLIIFLDFLEKEKFLQKFEKNLTKVNSANLSFSPMNEIRELVKNIANSEKENFKQINCYEEDNNINNNNKNYINKNEENFFDKINFKRNSFIKRISTNNNNNIVNNINDNNNNIKNDNFIFIEPELKEVLSPNISDRTFYKLKEWLIKLREIFCFYSNNNDKLMEDKMSYSNFARFAKDANLVYNNNNRKNFNNDLNKFSNTGKDNDLYYISKRNSNLNLTENNKINNNNTYKERNEKLEKIKKFSDKTSIPNSPEKDIGYNNNNTNNSIYPKKEYNNNLNISEETLNLSNFELTNNNTNNNIINTNIINSTNNNQSNFKESNDKNINKNFNKISVNQSLKEADLSLLFQEIVGKKSMNKNKLFKNGLDENLDNQEKYFKENKSIIINLLSCPLKLNFQLFIKSLEILSEKIYTKIENLNTENDSNITDRCFKRMINDDFPRIYENFLRKYEKFHREKYSETNIEKFLGILREEEIVKYFLIFFILKSFFNIFYLIYFSFLIFFIL
jgi:hypothetical protein